MEAVICNELEFEDPESAGKDAATAAFLGMVACSVILLLMLAA